MSLFRRTRVRRRELSRQRAARGSLWERVKALPNPWSLLAAVALAGGATVIVLYGGEALPYSKGQTVASKIVAPYSFRRENRQATLTAMQEASQQTPSVYVFNEGLITAIESELTDLRQLAKSVEDYETFSVEAQKRGHAVAEAGHQALRKLTAEPASRQYEQWLKRLPEWLASEPIVQKIGPAERDPPASNIVLVGGPRAERQLKVDKVVYPSDTEEVKARIQQMVEQLRARALDEVLTGLIVKQLQPDPANRRYSAVWVFDKKQTDEMLAEAEQRVEPQFDTWEKGDTVVPPGVIDEQEYALLQVAWAQYRQALRTDPQLARQRMLLRVGTAGLVALITVGLAWYVSLYQPRIQQNAARAWALALSMLVMLLLCRLLEMMGAVREWTVLPVAMIGAIFAIAYNQRFALGVTGTFCLLATMSVGGGLELFVVLLTTTGMTVVSLGEVRSRLKVLEVGAATAAAAFTAVFFVGLMGRQELMYILLHSSYAALAALAAAALIQAILPLVEKLFGIVTAMTLLEWCDVNKPLLKRLAQETPGTYNHSLVLGSMAEAAAESIGGNGLLVRVGAYYHDIGKINKPYYFVENYETRADRHEKLSPTMSLLIIVGHVKDGLELAREGGVPPVLQQFIAEHHGTTLVRYFYHAASERSQAEGKAAVPETEFRYAGPKPRSKESAILMLCDGAESAVRALQEPTPARIESTVHGIAMERLMDGQLDDCDITLKELAVVEESISKSLCAIYHGRIAYPKAAAQRAPRTA